MDEIIKICAKYLIIVPVLAELYIFWKQDKTNRRRMGILIIATAILSILIARSSASFFHDPRPQFSDGSTPLLPHSNDNGFPSDHTLLASVLAFTAYRFNKKIGYGLLVVALIIGWARVAAHVHHGVDIVGSIVIAALGYFLALKMYEQKYLKRDGKS